MDGQGPLYRQRDVRHRPGALPRAGAMDAPPSPRRQRDAGAEERSDAHRLSEARWAADVRPAYRPLLLEHQPWRGPADAPDAQGSVDSGEGEPGEIRRPREPLLP